MAPKRGWCKHCLDDYRHGDVIVRCSSCPRSFHRECLDNDILAHSTHSAYYQQNSDNPLDLSDFTCDSCQQYAQEAEIVNDERCKICKERNRDETDVLLLCDGCPNSYHMSCLNLQVEPDTDKWYCPMCKPEAFEGVNVRAQRRNPLTDTSDHVNSSICYVCQRHGKLLGCDFCSNSFHYDCLPEFDIDTIADVWECPCCRGEDPFLNQMHKRWTVSQIEKNSRTRRKSILTWRGVITRYRNRFILAHRNELSSFVATKIIDTLTKTFISNKNKKQKDKLKDVESQLELLQEEQLIESNKFVIKARKSCYYPSGRKKDNRPMRTGVSLKPHQEDGVDWLLKSFLTGGAILADEMGLGKTIQTLCFLSYLKMMNIEGPHLIVVPLSTVGNWLREIHRFTPHLTVVKICGSKTERHHAMSDRLAYSGLYDLFVTTYETVKCEEAFFVETVPRWQCLILDEAHRIKNQSGALRHSMDRIVSNMRLLLTGTPLQNNAQELFTLINFMFPDLFRDSQIMEQVFNSKKRFRTELEMNFTNEELDAIKLLLSKIMLRRLKEQAISLPKKIFHDVWLPLSQDTLKWYRTLMNIKSLMNENISIKKLLGIVIKMRIICGHPRGIVSRSQQLDKLYAFFKQEDDKIQKKVQSEANELQNLKGLPHIHASAKLTFLDKLLCQLHYENCRLVPNYHRTYQQHLKALDNSLYRKYTNTLNSANKDDNTNGTNKSELKQQTIVDSFNYLPSVRSIVKSEQEVILKNLTEFTLQVKTENVSLLHDENSFNLKNPEEFIIKKEEDVDNKDNIDTKVDLINLKLKTENDNKDDKEEDNKKNREKEQNEGSKLYEKDTQDDKDNDDKDEKEDEQTHGKNNIQKDKSKQKEKKPMKKNKLTKEQVLSKIENVFIRVPISTSGTNLYLSGNLKEVNLTHKCPYQSMKIYENALEQEEKYKKDKKKSSYKFESTRLVDIGQEEKENLLNYVNDPNKKTSKIIESDDDFDMDNKDNPDVNVKEENKENGNEIGQDNKLKQEEKEQNEETQELKLNNEQNDNYQRNNKLNTVMDNQHKLENEVQFKDEKVNQDTEKSFDDRFDDEDGYQHKIRMHKVLVFTQFQLVLDELESYCVNRGWKYMRLDGSTNKLIRELDIREFNSSNSNYFIYLISTRAGGLGINLTAANHVVLYDEDWNPFIDLQAIDRAHRIGQKRDVHIWKLISEWTVEERMALIREKKLQLDKLILHNNTVRDNMNNSKEVDMVGEGNNYNNDKDNKNNIENYIEPNHLDEETQDNNKHQKETNEESKLNEKDTQDNLKQHTTEHTHNLHDENDKEQRLGEQLLDEDDVIISLSHQAILKMMMHGNKALQHLECEQIIDRTLDEIVQRRRKLPPEDLDDTNDIVDDILISKSNQIDGDDRVIIELVKEEDEMDIVQEETEKIKKKKVSGLLVKDLINEEDVVDNKEFENIEQYNYDEVKGENKDNITGELGDVYDTSDMSELQALKYIKLLPENEEEMGENKTKGYTRGYISKDDRNEGFVNVRESGLENGTPSEYNNNHNNSQFPLDLSASCDSTPYIDTNIVLDNENDGLKPRRSRRSRIMIEMQHAGLLWRSVREKKKPNMIYTPVEWQKRGENKQLKHESKCFLCGKPKNFVAKYKDKDNNEVEVDYGELVKCFRCPKSYHKFCERLNVTKRNWSCRWHECCLCFRKSSQCGNLLIHCSNCPTSFCYDCFPPDYTRHYVSDEYYYNLTQRGLMANTTNWIFFLCSKCKIESERKKRSLSGEERDKHKKEQKQLRSELLTSIKNKDKEGTKEKKRLRTLLNKQEKARIEELKAQEAELEEKHRNLYQSLFPVNMIAELTNRINTDILNSSGTTTIGRPPKSLDKKYKKNKYKDNEDIKEEENNKHEKETKEESKLNEKDTQDDKDNDDKDEKEDEDWGVGLRARRRGLNFSNVRLPYRLLQFCDNCRIPLHNVYKNPMPCPFPKESIKLDLEINIRKSKSQGSDVRSEQASPTKLSQSNYDQGSTSTKSLELKSEDNNYKDNKKNREKEQNEDTQDNKLKQEEKEQESEKKVIKKGYCSLCYEKRGLRSSHLRRHCEFLTDDDRKEYQHRNELVDKAIKILESLVSKSPNNIDYSQYSNVKLKALYNHMLDQCDSLYFRALVDVGLLQAPNDNLLFQQDNKTNASDETTNTRLLEKNTRTKVSQLNHIQLQQRRQQYAEDQEKLSTPRAMSNNVVRNLRDTGAQLKEDEYSSNIDNKGLTDYVRSFNSIYRHRRNRDTLLLPIVYEEPKNNLPK